MDAVVVVFTVRFSCCPVAVQELIESDLSTQL